MYQGIRLKKTTYHLPCLAMKARANTTLPEIISTFFFGKGHEDSVGPAHYQSGQRGALAEQGAFLPHTGAEKKKLHTHTAVTSKNSVTQDCRAASCSKVEVSSQTLARDP